MAARAKQAHLPRPPAIAGFPAIDTTTSVLLWSRIPATLLLPSRPSTLGLGLLRSADAAPQTAVQIYYALLTYTLGFLAWEIPRVHHQPEALYAQQWADALTALPATEYPTLHELADELPQVASDSQFEAGSKPSYAASRHKLRAPRSTSRNTRRGRTPYVRETRIRASGFAS
jgi:hypothetical protein